VLPVPSALVLIVTLQVESTQAPPPRAARDDTGCAVALCPASDLSLAVDPTLSVRSGVENVTLLHHAVTRTEDRLLGLHWFHEHNVPTRMAGIVMRVGKYALLDLPVDYFAAVYTHEYFGHGGRYRELGIRNIDYGYDRPPPYGAGGGHASATIPAGLISDHELLAIWAGGLESHPLLERKLALRWMATRSAHYRDAALYWWTWQIMFKYVQSSGNLLTTGTPDNDPQAYVRILNRHAGYTNPDSLAMTVADLRRRNVVNLFNPFLVLSLVAQARALWEGQVSTALPGIPVGPWRYLPSFRMDLTPFGAEYHWENYVLTRDRVALLDLRIGDGTFHRGWGGGGLLVENLYGSGRFALDLDVNAWKQPKIELGGAPAVPTGGAIGAAASVRGHYQVARADTPLWAFVEAGYKTAGFLDGYALDASPILMVGLGWRR
jgi:hypothetical protein